MLSSGIGQPRVIAELGPQLCALHYRIDDIIEHLGDLHHALPERAGAQQAPVGIGVVVDLAHGADYLAGHRAGLASLAILVRAGGAAEALVLAQHQARCAAGALGGGLAAGGAAGVALHTFAPRVYVEVQTGAFGADCLGGAFLAVAGAGQADALGHSDGPLPAVLAHEGRRAGLVVAPGRTVGLVRQGHEQESYECEDGYCVHLVPGFMIYT